MMSLVRRGGDWPVHPGTSQKAVCSPAYGTQNALPAARKVETEGLQSPVDSLRYQKALLDLIGQLEAVGPLSHS